MIEVLEFGILVIALVAAHMALEARDEQHRDARRRNQARPWR